MRKPRNSKRGLVYLLKANNNQYDLNLPVYKYGCTQFSVKDRVTAANRYKYLSDPDFKAIAIYESPDIFKDENKVSYAILDGGWGRMCEFVSCTDLEEMSKIEKRFRRELKTRREIL